jgi:hypothetical protein
VFFRQTDPIISDREVQRVVEPEMDPTGAGLRVACDIGEGLLSNTIGGYLDRGGQRWEMIWRFHEHLHTIRPGASAVLSRLLADSPEQSQFIERGRTQVVDQAADIGNDRAQRGAPFSYQSGCLTRILRDQRSYRSCLEVEGGQGWSQAIVQVTTQAPTFFLACRYEPLACSLQFGCEPHGVSGYACLARKVIEQAAIGRGEGFSSGARSKQQLADDLSLVDQW